MKPILAALLFLSSSANLSAGGKVDLLVDGGTMVTMDAARTLVQDGAIAVRGERILAIGPSGEMRRRYDARRLIAAPDNKTPGDALAYTESYIRRWRPSLLIVPAVAPHAPYTNSAETLKACKLLADRYGMPMMIHVSETEDEVRQIREKYGMTATQWLESLHVLGPNVLFHHGVWLSDGDLAIIREYGVSVSHNPESNMKLASGTTPVLRMLSLGIAVGLGTDGAASNNNLDMFEAMDFAAKLHKLVHRDPTALPAPEVLEMATMGGARALSLGRDIGSLENGEKADFILVGTNAALLQPLHNVYSQLVYDAKGCDVRTSVINGKIVMLDGKVLTMDEKQILEKAKEYGRQLEGKPAAAPR